VAERDPHRSTEPPTPDGLTLKQTLFVEAYLGEAHGNGVAAARVAGYTGTPNTLARTAWELLRQPKISLRIRARVEEITGDTTAILQALWAVASAPTAHFMVVTREEQYDADGDKVRDMQIRQDYSAKVRALELLMRYHGMFAAKPPADVTVKALIGIDLNRI
jgi:hypothetical protein